MSDDERGIDLQQLAAEDDELFDNSSEFSDSSYEYSSEDDNTLFTELAINVQHSIRVMGLRFKNCDAFISAFVALINEHTA